MEIRRKGDAHAGGLQIQREGELVWLTFPMLSQLGCVRHLFSTRLGGVSTGHLSSMNLSYTRGDDPAHVDENFRRIGRILGKTPEDFVFTDQTHTVHVRAATEADRGKGSVRKKDYTDVDALVTDTPGLVLSAFFADCVPLYFVDPVKRAIGLAHSGWRGTVGRIGAETVKAMERSFGSRPSDILAAIGPSICVSCYEVGEDVARQFEEEFPERAQASEKGRFHRPVLTQKGNGKYLLDLWEANRRALREAGILREHIEITDICTCCNPDFLFSHRASRGKRGNMGAFLVLQPDGPR